MSNNSKNNSLEIPEEVYEEARQELLKIITSNEKDLVEKFCECLFTPAEIKDFINRWLLVKEIDKGTTQRDIAKKYCMSLCKITRGSKELNKKDSAFRKVLDSMK